jgi:hypothetical protein
MSGKEINKLKERLYSQIEQIESETTLLMLQEAVTEYSFSQIDIIEQLTPEQKQRLQASIGQAQEGKTVLHEEVQKKVNEWLSK